MSKSQPRSAGAAETANSESARNSKRRMSALGSKDMKTSKGGGSRSSSRTSNASSRDSKRLKPGDV